MFAIYAILAKKKSQCKRCSPTAYNPKVQPIDGDGIPHRPYHACKIL